MTSDAPARRREIDSRRFSIIDYWPNIVLFSQRLVRRAIGEGKAPQLADRRFATAGADVRPVS
ncbi:MULTISPECIES: hypothetical protein [Burkholderia]|uniref:hypothetical protein n=1 Tax=Burkholderia TaxID=32008 RepID=UPI00158CA43E|nr:MULTISPECIES: hypothetical protein [Burkholderia]MBY4871186.1 hypothetical protein [Burkholderia anthina]